MLQRADLQYDNYCFRTEMSVRYVLSHVSVAFVLKIVDERNDRFINVF